MLKLGYRFGMLQIVLELRKLTWTHPVIIKELQKLGDPKLANLSDADISRAFNATGADKIDTTIEHSEVVSALVGLIKRLAAARGDTFWDRHHTSPEQLEQMLHATDGDFLAYLSRIAHRKPDSSLVDADQEPAAPDTLILPNLNALRREEAVGLNQKLGGKCFLYRLGNEERRIKKNGKQSKDLVPMLRRIPVELRDTGAPYLEYHDEYSMYQADQENDYAEGSAFCTKDHFTIVAADYDSIRRVMELFLIQLDTNPLRWAGNDVYAGLMVMNGDQTLPTACKVLFRRAPDALQDLDWSDFALANEKKIEIVEEKDKHGNDTFSIRDDEREEEFDTPYSEYLDNLLIREAKIDVTLGWS
jgi:hypothetical protein